MRARYIPLILFLCSLIFPFQVAWACEQHPDYWFTENFSIGGMLLPENVTIELSPWNSTEGYLLIENASKTPLYVLPQAARQAIMVTAEPQVAEDGLAQENTPEEILLVNQVPELAVFVVTNEAPLQLDVENLPALVPYIEYRNIADYSRPSLVYLPITQRGEFHLVYNQQIFTVQFSIAYALNDQFSPEVCGEEIVPLAHQDIGFGGILDDQASVMVGSIAFLLIALLTLGGILKRGKKATTDKRR